MTQNDMVLAHLKGGPLTPLQALHLYGIMRTAARIAELKERGHVINTHIIESNGKRFAEYELVAETKTPPFDGALAESTHCA